MSCPVSPALNAASVVLYFLVSVAVVCLAQALKFSLLGSEYDFLGLNILNTFADSCDLVGRVRDIVLECNPVYSAKKEDKKHYFENWVYQPWNLTQEYLDGDSSFVYHTEAELEGKIYYLLNHRFYNLINIYNI